MKITPFSITDHQLRAMTRIFKLALIADAVLILGACVFASVTVYQASEVHRAAQLARSELAVLPSIAPAPRPVTDAKPVIKTGPVPLAQQCLVQSSSRHGCRIGNIETSTEVVPYASPFILGVSPSGWNQVTIRATVFGSMSAIVGTLHDMRDTAAPIELDSVDLSRQDVSEHGDVTVQAQLVFLVVTASGGPS